MKMETLTDWENWLRLRVSPSTVEAYTWELKQLNTVFPDLEAKAFRERDLTQFLAERQAKRPLSDSARKRSVAAFRSFFGWACKSKSPAAKLPYPKVHRRRQRSLTWDQVEKVLAAIDSSTDKGTRDLAMILLMLDTGLRVSEICRLTMADLNVEELSLQVEVKGGSEAYGVFTEYTAQQLLRWTGIRKRYTVSNNLFCSIGGLNPGSPLTRGGVKCEMRKLGQKVGIVLSPHDLRRTFAVLSTINGAPTRLLQKAGRWESLEMVARYTANVPAHAVRQYLPTNRLMKP